MSEEDIQHFATSTDTEKRKVGVFDKQHAVTSQLFSLIDAVSDLVSATGDLVSHHLELARLELRQDIVSVVNRVVLAVAIVLMLFFGYILLLAGAILLVGWGWGIPGMAIATLLLAFVHLGITIPQAKRLSSKIGQPAGFKRTQKELENTKQWMSKQIENSSLEKQKPVSELSEHPSSKN